MHTFSPAPHALSRALSLALAAMAAAAAPSGAFAQSIPGTNTSPVAYSSTGNTPPDQTQVGQPGTAGGDGSDYTVDAQAGQYIRTGTAQALFGVSSTGGNGGAGGMSNANFSNDGPLGGSGGRGGDVGFTMDMPSDDGATSSLLENYWANGGSVVSLSSQGGDAGCGQDNQDTGNGGVGGTGGDGGAVTYAMPLNPLQPETLTYMEATGGTVNLFSGGGRGGDSGQGQSDGTTEVTGRQGGAGGNGGNIEADVTGNITGYNGGSGIVALSRGGDGGTGGEATAYNTKATGADGGNAGVGGSVTINVDGGPIVAQGSNVAGTGPQQNFDSTGTATVPLNTSVTVGGILATSQGGVGGAAGTVVGGGVKVGNGAQGGAGGDVDIELAGAPPSNANNDNTLLSTSGYGAFGAVALSAGGNGGSSNSGNGVYFTRGGKGGSGGDGGNATIKLANDTTLPYAKATTTGDDSDALVAMSVGGGGGYSGDLTDTSAGSGGVLSVTIGGQGGNGGDGQVAYIGNGYYDPPPTNGGARAFHPGDVISTSGTYSRGMVAQSVGGGGGRGGDAINTALGSAVTIGGAGGTGGGGGLAQAVNFGLIDTSGQHSSGIFAQSVGGGGGTGGGAMSRVIGAQVSVAIGVGGSGGTGGNADEADGYNLGQSQTSGDNAHALMVQAVGGGGGVGGTAAAQNYNTSIPDTPSLSFTTTVGGSGGAGGNGGNATAMNAGLLQTQGQDAYGVFAQSVGGGGGAGGDASSTSMAYQQAKLDVTTAIGGAGKAGGKGGTVNVWNSGLITTDKAKSIGVFAQSVGGGGGTGGVGTTDAGGVYSAGDYSTQLSVAVGGKGGAAGNGGNVTVENYISADSSDPNPFSDAGLLSNRDVTGNGGILTQGDLAAGIFAQSVGGGGGNGGDSTGKGSNGQLNINVAVGGNGGAGGDGGTASVHNGNGAIETYGAQSYGVFAQSVGGGGGTGGNAATGSGDDPEYTYSKMAINLAANGNTSGFTQVTDNLWDWKDNVKGAWDDKKTLEGLYNFTQENPGKPVYSGLTTANFTVDVGAGFGGDGGAGGNGGTVTVDSAGDITTHGTLSYGMFGQSVGGGGGVGGASAPVTGNDQLHDSVIESAIAVGGTGGNGGNGGAVTLTNNVGGNIETQGDLAFGMFAQSVGAGGGVGGATMPNGGLGNPVNLTAGAQSTDATNAVSGQGEAASVTNAGSINTSGANAIGMFAQSVGGGGGLAAVMGQSQDPTTGLYHSSTQSLAQGQVKPTLGQNWTGSKNIGGSASVTLASGGNVTTQGANAFGILAQSVGGGGGLVVVDPNNQVSANQFAPNPDNYSPSGGNKAGQVDVTTQAQTSIVTHGNGAAGIVAQSLGGGGGIVNGLQGVNLLKGSAQVYQNRWDMGMGGNITVDNSADITTTGGGAPGIFVQAASGTGGVIGRTDGTGTLFRSGMGENMYCANKTSCGGAVAVNLNAGTITVSGQNSWGVAMESENVSFQTQENGPNIDQSTATLQVGSNARVLAMGDAVGAVLLNASGGNSVVNAGVIDAVGSAGDMAIYSVGKSYHVTNQAGGTISGKFGSNCSGDCTASAAVGTVDNAGRIEAGDSVDLGGGELHNSGVLGIAGAKIGATTLTGNYSGPGVLEFDADYSHGKGDRLIVNGTADVAGGVEVRSSTLRKQTLPLITATGGLTVQPQLSATSDKLLFTTHLDHDANTLYATPEAHFSEQAAGTGATSRAVADHLQQRFDRGDAMDAGFTALSKVDTAASYQAALSSMSGRALGSIGAFRFQGSRDFVSNLEQGCDTGSDQADCTWGRVQAGSASQKETTNGLGYNVDTQTFEAGAQHALRDGLTLSGAIGYDRSQFRDADGMDSVDGNGVTGGIGLRYDRGPLELSGVIDGGYGKYDSKRSIIVGNQWDQATAKPGLWNAGLHLQASYTLDFNNSYLKPFAELRGTQVHGEGYTEQGSSPFNLAVQSQNQLFMGGGLGAEWGTSRALGNGARLGVYVNGAVEAGDGNDWTTRAHFADEPAGDTFDMHTNVPGTYGRVGVGMNLANWKHVDLSVNYSTEFGGGYRANAGVARLAWHF